VLGFAARWLFFDIGLLICIQVLLRFSCVGFSFVGVCLFVL
jgi:hypothetical protein